MDWPLFEGVSHVAGGESHFQFIYPQRMRMELRMLQEVSENVKVVVSHSDPRVCVCQLP